MNIKHLQMDERICPHWGRVPVQLHRGGLVVGRPVWSFAIQIVSRSEGGIEGVYQSSAIIPHWHVTADERGRWDVRIRWRIGPRVGSPHLDRVPGEIPADALSQ
jgi:hypothetical protein